jgi:hypothetical protein
METLEVIRMYEDIGWAESDEGYSRDTVSWTTALKRELFRGIHNILY